MPCRCGVRGSLSGRRCRKEVTTILSIVAAAAAAAAVVVVTATSCRGRVIAEGIKLEICIQLLLGLELAELLAPGSVNFALGVVVCATTGWLEILALVSCLAGGQIIGIYIYILYLPMMSEPQPILKELTAV